MSTLEPILKPHHSPIFVVTGVLGVGFVLGLILPRGQNAGLIRMCVMLTTFNMWIFWVTVYTSQMNPLMAPKLSNTSLAWISFAWGDLPKSNVSNSTDEGDLSAATVCVEVPGGPTCPVQEPTEPTVQAGEV